jgi:hypothetical protein
LEQHHRFIQRVIQNQKKIEGNRSTIPLIAQRGRTTDQENDTNRFNIVTISSDSSISSITSSENDEIEESNSEGTANNDNGMNENSSSNTSFSSSSGSSSNSSSSSNSDVSMISDTDNSETIDDEEQLIGFNASLEPVNRAYLLRRRNEMENVNNNDDTAENDRPQQGD